MICQFIPAKLDKVSVNFNYNDITKTYSVYHFHADCSGCYVLYELYFMINLIFVHNCTLRVQCSITGNGILIHVRSVNIILFCSESYTIKKAQYSANKM